MATGDPKSDAFHPEEVLRKCVQHIFYERAMFEVALTELHILGQGPPPSDPSTRGARNAWIEVYLLHCRVLTCFLCKPRQQDDLVAADYVPDWSVVELPATLNDSLRSLNKRMFHLSAYRANDVSLESDLELWTDFADTISGLWTRFCEQLEPDMLSLFEAVTEGDEV